MDVDESDEDGVSQGPPGRRGGGEHFRQGPRRSVQELQGYAEGAGARKG